MSEMFDIAHKAVSGAKRLVVLTGAGISVASGVSTYMEETSSTRFLRSVTTDAFEADPDGVWLEHLKLRRGLAGCKPNAAHLALTKLARAKPHIVLTQNIDGLHEQSGHPHVFGLHGSLWCNRCTACGEERDDASLELPGLPMSPCCSALERPAIVWFGDKLKRETIRAALMALRVCEVLLVVGTSGTVAPVSDFAHQVMAMKRLVIEVNPDPTGLVPSDICLRGPAEEILPRLLSA